MAAATKTSRTARDESVERILAAHVVGGKFDYVDAFPLTEIGRNPDSQSRLRSADKKRVIEFAEKMKNGEVFPPVIVWQIPDNGAFLVEGNTRTEATNKRGLPTIPAYVVTLTSMSEAVYLSAVFNARNGSPLTADEIRRAVLAASKIKPTPTNAQIARDYGISTSQIGRILTEDAAEKRLTDLGVPSVEKMKATSKARLAKITMDAPCKAAADLANDAGMTPAEVKELVDEVLAIPSEVGQIDRVNAARAARSDDIKAIAAGRRTTGTPQVELRRVSSQLIKLTDTYPDTIAWVPTDLEHLRTWTPRITKLAEFLDVLQAAYGSALETAETMADAEATVAEEAGE